MAKAVVPPGPFRINDFEFDFATLSRPAGRLKAIVLNKEPGRRARTEELIKDYTTYTSHTAGYTISPTAALQLIAKARATPISPTFDADYKRNVAAAAESQKRRDAEEVERQKRRRADDAREGERRRLAAAEDEAHAARFAHLKPKPEAGREDYSGPLDPEKGGEAIPLFGGLAPRAVAPDRAAFWQKRILEAGGLWDWLRSGEGRSKSGLVLDSVTTDDWFEKATRRITPRPVEGTSTRLWRAVYALRKGEPLPAGTDDLLAQVDTYDRERAATGAGVFRESDDEDDGGTGDMPLSMSIAHGLLNRPVPGANRAGQCVDLATAAIRAFLTTQGLPVTDDVVQTARSALTSRLVVARASPERDLDPTGQLSDLVELEGVFLGAATPFLSGDANESLDDLMGAPRSREKPEIARLRRIDGVCDYIASARSNAHETVNIEVTYVIGLLRRVARFMGGDYQEIVEAGVAKFLREWQPQLVEMVQEFTALFPEIYDRAEVYIRRGDLDGAREELEAWRPEERLIAFLDSEGNHPYDPNGIAADMITRGGYLKGVRFRGVGALYDEMVERLQEAERA